MSGRRGWLEEWCPECRAAPGARCRQRRWSVSHQAARPVPVRRLRITRGWRARSCPTCKAVPGECCRTPSGREAGEIHVARLRLIRRKLSAWSDVWDELQRRGATVAVVPFAGRAGRGGETDTISLLRPQGDELVDVERWTSRDELCFALEAPIWDRFGTFAGQPLVRREAIWSTEDRCVVIRDERGGRAFEELAA